MYTRTFSRYGQIFELLLIKLRLNAPILSILFYDKCSEIRELVQLAIAYAISLPKHSSKGILLTKQRFIQAIDSSVFKKEKYKILNIFEKKNVAGDFVDQVTIVQFRHTVVFFLDSGWRHLVIAVWRFDGSIGQCAGEFFFGRSAGARPDRWSIRRPMVRLTRCWAWRRVDRRRASRGRVNLRCLLFDPACQCHSSSSRHSHADPPADLPPTASCRRAFQQYLVKQNRSKQTT
ncbi:hypothetical protein T07_4028 [Trichinella nelsoni]|uniref:Uncharacterized protein n=1 Tax=Trichinella nelsoni TaxID=6336 RepID=A0A0V0SNC9_9BILA|nr:hypothetical protein T07_4028 [Trichinella nelsoni]